MANTLFSIHTNKQTNNNEYTRFFVIQQIFAKNRNKIDIVKQTKKNKLDRWIAMKDKYLTKSKLKSDEGKFLFE